MAPDAGATLYCPVSSLCLRKRLGRWLPSHSAHRRWPAYQDDVYLFIKSPRGFLAHMDTLLGCLPSCTFNGKPCSRHYNLHSIDDAVPTNLSPLRCGTIQAATPGGFFYNRDLDRSDTDPTTFQKHLSLLDPWELSLFEYHIAYGNPLALWLHLQDPASSPLYLAHNRGATDRWLFGWIIASGSQILWEGSGRTFGHKPGSF
jgi:hypothetical protein